MDLNSPFDSIKTIIEMRRVNFDLAINFEQRLKLSSLIVYFVGVTKRIGFSLKGYFRDYLYTKKIIHNSKQHEFECMAELTYDITGKISDKKLEFWISQRDIDWTRDFLNENNLVGQKIVILHPGCGAEGFKAAKAREWPIDNFAELGDALIMKYNVKIIISGTKSKVCLAEKIASQMNNEPLILAGKVTIGQLSAILKEAFLFVSGDTGIMYLAVACGVKTIAIFGPSDVKRWRPLSDSCKILKSDLSCMPCQVFGVNRPKCNTFRCIESL